MLPALVAVFFLLGMSEQPKPQLLVNQDFAQGVSGWRTTGTVSAVSGGLKLSAGSSITRDYQVPGLRILYFGAKAKEAKPGKGHLKLTCLNRAGKPVMQLDSAFNAKGEAGIYLKTQAFTASVRLTVEAGEGGGLELGPIEFTDDDRDVRPQKPRVDLDQMMSPIEQGQTVWNESVLLLTDGKSAPMGKLLFTPTRILSVRNAELTESFTEGVDYKVEGRELIALPGSKIPTMSTTEFAKGEFPWTPLQGRHLFVSYRHEDTWGGPVFEPQAEALSRTLARLKAKKPTTIVAYGDSITLGINVSGFRNVPPFQPPWPTLVQHELVRRYGAKIKLYNTALGGMTSQWAKDNAVDAVAALKPNLVIIAFGMNDFWSLTPAQFRANIESTLHLIQSTCPDCEFLLVAPMKFDPAYTADPTYVGNLNGYAAALQSLCAPGVALLDMTAMTDYLYRMKSAKDLETDPMHPDDFLARFYAQGVVKLLSTGP